MPRQRSKKSKKAEIELLLHSLPQININAAGIDIGSSEHWVGVPQGRGEKSVRSFEAFTVDLYRLADWLQECGIKTVVMESTGVYWIPLFQILEERGFEVKLVNAKHAKNVPGRKTDILDCQWLQQLHTFGLLSGSFRPDADVCVLRSYLRQRDNLINLTSIHVQHMQKALTQMNLKLDKVISDITGVTGMRILRAIVDGERDLMKLADLTDRRIKSSKEEIAKSLVGDYRTEHMFALKQALEFYDFYHQKIDECDQQIQAQLKSFQPKVDLSEKPLSKPKQKRNKPLPNQPKFDLRPYLYKISGVDLTKIDGINVLTAQTIISEIGLDMSKWPTEKHFTSWLGLSPNNRITGGKVISSKTRKVKNRAATALRLAAQSLKASQTALGGYFRRMRARLGPPKAITATAHKLARLVYRMLKYGEEYVDAGVQAYEQKYQDRMLRNLKKSAASLGYQLSPIAAMAEEAVA
jgi:transposase